MGVHRFSFFFLASITVCLACKLCTPEDITDENVLKLAKASNHLCFSTYQQLALQSSENILFSPFSLSTAFGILYYGTKGETAKELRQTLGYESARLPKKLVHRTFHHYLTKTLPSSDSSAYVLTSANAAVLDKSLDIYSSYKKDIRGQYQAMVKEVDFTRENRDIVLEVNNWVKDKTNSKIDKLLDKLDNSTVFLLLNAVYFKGTWRTKFKTSNTKPQKFYNNGLVSRAKDVPMMRLKEKFLYAKISDLKADVIEIPYKGGNISMIVFLPHERNGFATVEHNLSLEKIKFAQLELRRTKVSLTLPKFKVEYSKEMSGDFRAMGAKSLFSPSADFSGMTKRKNVYVNQVIHKAVVEVNEKGSVVAAVTGTITSRRMKPISVDVQKMVVDHPFIFAIVDKRCDMILFAGRVTNL